jgi:hypothetical protein
MSHLHPTPKQTSTHNANGLTRRSHCCMSTCFPRSMNIGGVSQCHSIVASTAPEATVTVVVRFTSRHGVETVYAGSPAEVTIAELSGSFSRKVY